MLLLALHHRPGSLYRIIAVSACKQAEPECEVLDLVQDLLADSNPMVVANAVAALADIRETSTRNVFSLNTQSLQKLLRALNECTEWGQVGATGRILSCMPECATTCMQRLWLGLFNLGPMFPGTNVFAALSPSLWCNRSSRRPQHWQLCDPVLITQAIREP